MNGKFFTNGKSGILSSFESIMRNLFFFVLSGLFLFTGLRSKAQDTHFLYIQSDVEPAFYVQSGDQLVSTTSGYLILSKLKPGIFNINLGFPKNRHPKQRFEITLDKDKGFQLRKSTGGNWELYDWSTKITIASTENQLNEPIGKTPDAESGTKSTAAPDAPRTEPVASSVGKAITGKQESETLKQPAVWRYDQQYRPGKRLMYYQVQEARSTDTVIIEMPLQEVTLQLNQQKASIPAASEQQQTSTRPVVEKNNMNETASNETAATSGTVTPNPVQTHASEKPGASKPAQEPADSAAHKISIQPEKKADQQAVNATEKTKLPSNCSAAANQNDFLQLRSRMARERTDDNMVLAARKFLLKKCISTEQVRNLTVLFLTDFGRYKFLDACYNYCNDPQRYPELETLLSEPYFVNRFKAMLR